MKFGVPFCVSRLFRIENGTYVRAVCQQIHVKGTFVPALN